MVKIGGTSWNGSPKGKKGMQTRNKCRSCGREYKTDWARNKHEKVCPMNNPNSKLQLRIKRHKGI